MVLFRLFNGQRDESGDAVLEGGNNRAFAFRELSHYCEPPFYFFEARPIVLKVAVAKHM